MKICFITYSIFDLGGIQRVTSVISSELSKNHDVEIVCTNTNQECNRELYNLSDNVKVNFNNLLKKNMITKATCKIFKELNKKFGILNNKRIIKLMTQVYYPTNVQNQFIEFINNNKYDVVIGVGGEYSLLLGIIAERVNCKTIGWQHNSFDAYLKTKGRYFWNQDELFKEYISNLDNHIVLTEYDCDRYKEEMNINSDVIYNPKSFSSIEKSNVSSKQFLAAGRFNYQKGFDLLIESFNEFCKNNQEWNLVIVGEGEEREKIAETIRRYNLEDRIRIDKFTTNIKEYFLSSSVLLLPSRWEGMPMIVLESFEMGVPVVAYNISAAKQLIRNNNEGILVEKYNFKEFSEAMLKMTDEKQRIEISKNTIRKSKEFEVSVIIKKWNKLLGL